MTNEEKAIIMKPLHALAEHYGIQNMTNISFKKRSRMLSRSFLIVNIILMLLVFFKS
jgi:hypothetical protein